MLGEPVGHGHARERALTGLIAAPHRTGEVVPHNHFDLDGLGFLHQHGVGIDQLKDVVGDDMRGFGEPEVGQTVQHRTLVGDGRFQHRIEGREAVGNDDEAVAGGRAQAVADFATVEQWELGGGEMCERVHQQQLKLVLGGKLRG